MSFTHRLGIVSPQVDIVVRNDAPTPMRNYISQLMMRFEPSLKKIRKLVCFVVKEPEDPNNWGENDFMKSEILEIINNCQWNRIYDIIEEFYNQLSLSQKPDFEKEVNEYFYEKGIGWKLNNGLIEVRGDEVFENEIKKVEIILEEKGLKTSKGEIKEAIVDLSRRPAPEVTGAIQHSLAALECVCREVTGDHKATLGTLINNNSNIVPKPLDEAIKKIWGFSSEQGRHLQEGRIPCFEEAELLVHLSASLCSYLSKKI
jgi:hypothetical protein